MNGNIPLSGVCLACALRFWAGGDPYDVMIMFGISYCEVFRSINFSLHAINQTQSLDIKFPTDHQKQTEIAEEFKKIHQQD